MYPILNYLSDSVLVGKIQKYFGIETTNKENYKINNKFFYYFFLFITHLGNEIFYILFLPILTWNFDDTTVCLTCMSWSISMYLGQASKEIFKIPRPTVVKLEKQYAEEYGFPSTHAMAATSICLSFTTLVYESGHFDSSNVIMKYIFISTAGILCVLISISRIYLGMHSVLDVIAGTIFAYGLSSLFLKVAFTFDFLIKSSLFYGFAFYFFCIFVCFLYPERDRWSTARADTILILGVVAGLVMGMSVKYSFDIVKIGKFSLSFELTVNYFCKFFARFFSGSVAVFIVRFMFKKIIFYIAVNFFNYKKFLDSNSVVDQLKELTQKKFSFEFCLYFFTYSAVSFTVIFLAFVIFEIFNLK
jgi:membrane-associated phospholipid phosphatase